MLLGDPPKIKSVRGILYDKNILMEILIGFYEDIENEGEEDVDGREEEK